MNTTISHSPADPAQPNTPLRLSWLQPVGLYALSAVNFVLRILTLGIYHFWGKTEVRKRLWSAIRVEGEPLVYTGTGKELFLGFLVVFGLVFLPFTLLLVALTLIMGPESGAAAIVQALFYVLIFYLAGVGIYRAQMYRLSRTSWRGIRGGLAGSSWGYAWTYFWTIVLPFGAAVVLAGVITSLTAAADPAAAVAEGSSTLWLFAIPLLAAFWVLPWRTTKLQRIMVENMRFGTSPFTFTASAGPLYTRFAVFWAAMAVVLAAAGFAMFRLIEAEIPNAAGSGGAEAEPSISFLFKLYGLFGLVYLFYAVAGAWYRAFQINYFASQTRFGAACFESKLTAAGLIWIGVTNLLIVLFTLGLLTPIAQARSLRYLVENTRIKGTVPLSEIAQSADMGPMRGEGLAQAFDVDVGGI